MGQKPEKSVLYAELAKLTKPQVYYSVGNATPFPGWKNPGWLHITLTDWAQKSEKVMGVLGSILTGGHDDCFPKKKDERSLLMKAATSHKYIGNFISDFENFQISLKRLGVKRLVKKNKEALPNIARSPYLTQRLAYLTAADIEKMLPLLEENAAEKAEMSGHYFLIDDKEFVFPARLFTTNIAVLDILNYAIKHNLQRDLRKELSRLPSLDQKIFGSGMKYPYCFQ